MQQDGEDRGGRPEERDGEGAVQDQLLPGSVADPDPNQNPGPSDPYNIGPPGSGSEFISQRYGSGSGSSSSSFITKQK